MTESSSTRLATHEHVARITLAAPERHNAVTAADAAALRRYFDEVDRSESVRVLILDAEPGPTFCAGASLAELESGAMSGARFEELADRLAAVRVPTICAIGGDVFGGGAELATCCDFRIGVHGMRLSVPASRLGVCYPLGGLTRFTATLGPTVTARLLLAAEELDAEELSRVGFLTRLVARDELTDTVNRLAERIASNAPLAVQAMKRIVSELAAGTLNDASANAAIDRCARSEDLKEGLLARREKRQPHFRGG